MLPTKLCCVFRCSMMPLFAFYVKTFTCLRRQVKEARSIHLSALFHLDQAFAARCSFYAPPTVKIGHAR